MYSKNVSHLFFDRMLDFTPKSYNIFSKVNGLSDTALYMDMIIFISLHDLAFGNVKTKESSTNNICVTSHSLGMSLHRLFRSDPTLKEEIHIPENHSKERGE